MLERLAALLIIAFARAVTGVRALWLGGAPTAAPTLYFANHRSHGDFVLLWACLPPDLRTRTRPVAGADYWNKSALRRFIAGRVFNAVLIDRTGQRGTSSGEPDPVEQIAQVLEAGDSVIFFPEGTRNETDEVLLPFKGGLHRLVRRCPQAQFTPVWIDNLHRVLPKGEVIPVPLACLVAFGRPLPQETLALAERDAFLAAARTALLDLRPEHARNERSE
jgi:1-acyl-sn-glycerol-3-phosphate acyltransferase